jgi:hypothetical protein
VAEYIKFRLTAAKVGVSMALLALIAGVAEKASSRPAVVKATPAASDFFLKLGGITGGVKTALVKLEDKWIKLDSALSKFEHKITGNYYDKHAINGSFLKIKSANDTFLKTVDANAKFLPATGTAANASKLGGLAPDAFVQGHANVISGAVTVGPGAQAQTLLPIPSGTQGGIIVVCSPAPAGAVGVQVSITNTTKVTIPAVLNENSDPTAVELPAGQTTPVATAGADPKLPVQFQLQTFPTAALNEVMTLTVSIEPSATPGQASVVGQMLIGLL